MNGRADLAVAQARLVHSLLTRAPPPDGFDPVRILAASNSLEEKRLRTVTRAWPELARQLGPHFRGSFLAYAERFPGSPPGGPIVDGFEFARDLAHRGRLPSSLKGDLLAFALTRRVRNGGIRPRRVAMKVCLLDRPRRLVVGVCLPRRGPLWWSLRLGR